MEKWSKILLVFLVCLNSSCATEFIPPRDLSKSDHYDGSRFFNPSLKEPKTFWDFLKWRFTADTTPWPSFRPLEKTPDLSKVSDEKQIKITFINHSSFLIQTKDKNILTDPIWSERASPVSFAGPKRAMPVGIEFNQLPKIDVIIVSHNHYDHFDVKTLKMISDRDKPQIFVPLGDRKYLEDREISNVRELDWNDEVTIDNDHQITFLKCRHWSARGITDRFKSLWGAYHLQLKNKSLYFAGDTGYAEHFKEAAVKFPKIDIALIPVGAYEPRWFMKNFHLNPEDAILAAKDLKSKINIGMHLETFQLTDEGIDVPRSELNRLIKEKYPEVPFLVLKNGETYNQLIP